MARPVIAAAAALLTLLPAAASELHVYAGAGLKMAMDALAADYEAASGNKVVIEYGGSGQILARYKETRVGDLFVPGSASYLDGLKSAGLVVSDRPLVEHDAVLAVASGKTGEIRSLDDLAKPGVRVGLGDAKAMALGKTADDILAAAGLADKVAPNVTLRAATVKQLAMYVAGGDVDAAIIGAADASMSMGKFAVVAIPRTLYTPDIVPVAVLSTTVDRAAADGFAAALGSDKGLATWKKFGFVPAP